MANGRAKKRNEQGMGKAWAQHSRLRPRGATGNPAGQVAKATPARYDAPSHAAATYSTAHLHTIWQNCRHALAGCGLFAGPDAAVRNVGTLAGPIAPRRFLAGAEGFATGRAAGGRVEAAHVHLPLA